MVLWKDKVTHCCVACRFDEITEDTTKDLPWIFRLLPVDHEHTKIEFFSVVSEEELKVSFRVLAHRSMA